MAKNLFKTDFLVVGCGVLRLSVGIVLLKQKPSPTARIVEKNNASY